MPVGVFDAAQQPAVLRLHRVDLARARPMARSTTACGSSSISSSFTVLPASDSGLKLPLAGASSATQNEAPLTASWATTSSSSSVPPTR